MGPWAGLGEWRSLGEEQVEVAVAVVVEQSNAASGRLDGKVPA